MLQGALFLGNRNKKIGDPVNLEAAAGEQLIKTLADKNLINSTKNK